MHKDTPRDVILNAPHPLCDMLQKAPVIDITVDDHLVRWSTAEADHVQPLHTLPSDLGPHMEHVQHAVEVLCGLLGMLLSLKHDAELIRWVLFLLQCGCNKRAQVSACAEGRHVCCCMACSPCLEQRTAGVSGLVDILAAQAWRRRLQTDRW